jgi:hypothetical protein
MERRSSKPHRPSTNVSDGVPRSRPHSATFPNPPELARQLQIIYDGAGLAAGMDRDPSIATSARGAAEALLDASL